MDERPSASPNDARGWPRTSGYPDENFEMGEVSHVSKFDKQDPTDLTLEMPIPDFARPPGDMASVLRDHFDGAKQDFSARIRDGVQRQLDEAEKSQNIKGVMDVNEFLPPETKQIRRIPSFQEELYRRNVVENFQEIATSRVREVVDASFSDLDERPNYHLYIVWFCKTLQHWKALVCTTLEDSMYYEVTYNGDKHETYVDCYKKIEQAVIYNS